MTVFHCSERILSVFYVLFEEKKKSGNEFQVNEDNDPDKLIDLIAPLSRWKRQIIVSLSLSLSQTNSLTLFFSLSPSFSRIVPNLHPLLSPSPRYLSFAKIFWLGFGLGNASNVTRRLSRLGLRIVDIGVTVTAISIARF